MNHKLLIVEDEIDLSQMMTLQAKKHHFECEVDNMGSECLSKAHAMKPDAILLDLNLPKISGLGLIRQLKTIPSLAHIPIIVFSANNDDLVVSEAMDLGASAFHNKNSPWEQLFETIRHYIIASNPRHTFLDSPALPQ